MPKVYARNRTLPVNRDMHDTLNRIAKSTDVPVAEVARTLLDARIGDLAYAIDAGSVRPAPFHGQPGPFDCSVSLALTERQIRWTRHWSRYWGLDDSKILRWLLADALAA
jgi:hypothetical protein